MPSEYRLIRYIPDVIADERVTLGVVVSGEGRIFVRCTDRWDKIKCWAGPGTIRVLQDFASEIQASQREFESMAQSPYSYDLICHIAERWRNTVQFSEPRASLLTPEALFRDVVVRFLRRPRLAPRVQVRDKRTVRVNALLQLKSAAKSALGKNLASKALVRRPTLIGKFDRHRFDAGVKNGALLSAAAALSFELLGLEEDLRKDVDSTAWAIDDVRKVLEYRTLPISVLVFPPRRELALYGRARTVFEGLGATVVEEAAFPNWALEEVSRISG